MEFTQSSLYEVLPKVLLVGLGTLAATGVTYAGVRFLYGQYRHRRNRQLVQQSDTLFGNIPREYYYSQLTREKILVSTCFLKQGTPKHWQSGRNRIPCWNKLMMWMKSNIACSSCYKAYI